MNDIPIVEATPLFRTTIRQKITPFLPPPIVVALRQIDPQLEPYIGPEPTVTLIGSLLMAVFFWKLFGSTLGRKGKAIANLEEDEELTQDDRYFHATLLFCGPSLAGKTSLFYQLLHPNTTTDSLNSTATRIRTVKSIKSHRDFWVVSEKNQTQKTIRVLDTPGHWGPTKLMDTFLKKETIDRIVLVVDSTQPVASAADYLYALLSSSLSLDRKIPIMVACHKSKSPKAKNFRRIKLQLRTELERLAKLDTSTKNKDINPQDWDQRLQTCGFCSSSCCDDPPVLDELKAFCQTGTLAVSS